MIQFPPSPWNLRAEMHVGVFAVPTGELKLPLPRGYRPVSLLGHSVIGLAFLEYGPQGDDSVLAYRELLSAVLVRRGWRFRVHLPWIWVDNEASLAGGRALWSIPKELARFQFESGALQAWAGEDDGQSLGQLTHPVSPSTGALLPVVAWLRLVQTGPDDAAQETPFFLRGWARLSRARSGEGPVSPHGNAWHVPPASPLSRLTTRARALFHVTLPKAQIRFGDSP